MSQTLEDLLGGENIDELDDDGKTRLIQLLEEPFGLLPSVLADNDNDALTLIRAGCDLDWQSIRDGLPSIGLTSMAE